MRLERTVGRHDLVLETKTIGKDLLVLIYGGDEHHIGGVSIAYPTKSHYRDAYTISLNSTSLPGHKDYVLSNSIAEKLSKALTQVVTVVVGIHMDNASEEEIKMVVQESHAMADEVLRHLKQT